MDQSKPRRFKKAWDILLYGPLKGCATQGYPKSTQQIELVAPQGRQT